MRLLLIDCWGLQTRGLLYGCCWVFAWCLIVCFGWQFAYGFGFFGDWWVIIDFSLVYWCLMFLMGLCDLYVGLFGVVCCVCLFWFRSLFWFDLIWVYFVYSLFTLILVDLRRSFVFYYFVMLFCVVVLVILRVLLVFWVDCHIASVESGCEFGVFAILRVVLFSLFCLCLLICLWLILMWLRVWLLVVWVCNWFVWCLDAFVVLWIHRLSLGLLLFGGFEMFGLFIVIWFDLRFLVDCDWLVVWFGVVVLVFEFVFRCWLECCLDCVFVVWCLIYVVGLLFWMSLGSV